MLDPLTLSVIFFPNTWRRRTAQSRPITHLCGLGDGGQLSVLRVPPPEQLTVSADRQAAVSIGADLLHLHPRQVAPHLHRGGADVVVAQTWRRCQEVVSARP